MRTTASRAVAVESRPGTLFDVRTIWSSPRAMRIASIIAVLTAWEVFGRDVALFTSYPSAIIRAAGHLFFDDDRLLDAFRTTVWGLASGYAIASTLGISFGFAMARIHVLNVALDPYVTALYATPRITLIPLLVLWVGVDFKLRLTIVVLSTIFPVIINVRDGAMQVDSSYLDVARSLNASRWKTFQSVVLPGSLPYVFVSLRMAAQRSMIAIIVAEMTASIAGTGRLIADLGRSFQTDRLMVPIIVIGFFSIFLTWGLRRIEHVVAPWSHREA